MWSIGVFLAGVIVGAVLMWVYYGKLRAELDEAKGKLKDTVSNL